MTELATDLVVDEAWQWWWDKLHGRPVINDGRPHAGFYRKRTREFYGGRRTFTPVAYWPDGNGGLLCREGDKNINETQALQLWQWVNDQPVSQEAFREVAEHDGRWPDEHEAVPMQGHNRPPPDNSYEGILAAIEDLERYATLELGGPSISDQDRANRIGNLVDALAEQATKAEEQRKLERKPHDDEIARIDGSWKPLIERAKSAYTTLKEKLITPWLAKLSAEQKKEAEAAAAEGQPAAAESPRPRAGTRGRAISLRTTKKARIDDYELCRNHFAQHEDMKACVQMLANRVVRTGGSVPGATLIEEQKAV